MVIAEPLPRVVERLQQHLAPGDVVQPAPARAQARHRLATLLTPWHSLHDSIDSIGIGMRNAAAHPSLLARSVSMRQTFSTPGNACST